jgi:hypothetical protein
MTPLATSAGYSGTPLPQKLGLKDGQLVLFIDLPDQLAALATAREFAAVQQGKWGDLATATGLDVVHAFTTSRATLDDNAAALRRAIAPDGMVWISWPKRASGIKTDMTEDVIRELLLPTGLVDVKVAAIDAIWSGLKLVIRRELR